MLVARTLREGWVCPGCRFHGYLALKRRRVSTLTVASRPDVARATKKLKRRRPCTEVQLPSTLRWYQASPARPEATEASQTVEDSYTSALNALNRPDRGIRVHLTKWQETYGTRNIDLPTALLPAESDDGVTNDSMRLQMPDGAGGATMVDDDAGDDSVVSTFDDISGVEYEYLTPGDYVEIDTPDTREPVAGIFVRELGVNTAQVYTISGKWTHVKSRGIPFSIPGFMDPALLKDMLPYLPQQEDIDELNSAMHLADVGVPRNVASTVLTKLIEFWREVQAVYRRHASVLDNAHSILAHETDLRFGTLEKIARKLLGGGAQPSHAMLVAVRKSLSRSQGFAVDLRSHRFTRVFLIHPKDHVKANTRAADWIRQWQEQQADGASDDPPSDEPRKSPAPSGRPMSSGARHVENFIQKARLLIETGRKFRPENDLPCVSPSTIQHPITPDKDGYRVFPSLEFSDADRVLIDFLVASALRREFRSHPHYTALVSALLRGIEKTHVGLRYSHGAGYKLLQELGVAKPYENRVLHNEHMLLPNTKRSKALLRLRDAVNTVNEQAEFPDRMQHLRRDWGDTCIYAIDASSAMNIDDGISIEPVSGQSKQWWIRIHIANPTARINKGDDVARMAAHMTETYYAPDDHHWMLPSWVTQKFMSIAADRPVLTFSARVDGDCNMLEYDVQPGIVRKVLKLTPSAVTRLLSSVTPKLNKQILKVGNAPDWFSQFDREEELPSITNKEREELGTLFDLAAARSRQRLSNGGVLIDYPRPLVATTYSAREGAPAVSQMPISTNAAQFMEGDPAIRVACSAYTGFAEQKTADTRTASTMVQEMMLLAGEIGARWCADRNIPILYRGTYQHGSAASVFNAAEFFRTYITPHVDKSGRVPDILLEVWMRLVGRTATTLTPMRHELSGLEQYAKLTTPLGRYSDMISHWQIESALREEARTGTSLIGSVREDYLAFTRAELAPVVPRLRAREQLLIRSEKFCEEHWITQLFFRAHHFGEAELPETLEVIVNSGSHDKASQTCPCRSTAYGISLQVTLPAEKFKRDTDGEVYGRAGDRWEVAISAVDPWKKTIIAKPLRLLHREPYKLDDLLKSDLSALVI